MYLWNVEGRNKCESGIFGKISQDIRWGTRFCQLNTVDRVYNIGLEAARSVGASICMKQSEFPPTWTGDR